MKLPQAMRKVQKYPGPIAVTGRQASVIVPMTTSTAFRQRSAWWVLKVSHRLLCSYPRLANMMWYVLSRCRSDEMVTIPTEVSLA